MNSTRRKGWFAFLAIVLAIVAALVISELALRILYPQLIGVSDDGSTDSVLKPDPHLGFVLVPNSPGQDAWGFKNSSVPTAADIVAIGDSHTYGILGGADWPTDLGKETGKSVYNMSVWGYGPAEYSALLPKALTLKPKIVLVALFMGNDLFNAYDIVYHRAGWEKYQNQKFTDANPTKSSAIKQLNNIPFQDIRDYLRSHLALYTLIGNSTRNLREYLGLASPRTIGTSNWKTNDPDASLRFEVNPATKTLFWPGGRIRGLDLSTKEVAEGLSLTKRFMLEMARESKAGGAQIVFVIVPEKESVYADAAKAAGLSNSYYDSLVANETKAREELMATCAADSISCFDMLPALSADIGKGQTLYAETWDQHPVAAGYQAYADAIAEYLSKKQ